MPIVLTFLTYDRRNDMKDLEKIKSEDLGCQVQDANPGNFAIEQEVAQLVGATVPAPTEPSTDDARELGAQLLVFLRRALTPIQTALRTAVAAIYAHLDSRCTDYTPAAYDPFRLPAGPYDPMRPFVPRTLPNLLTAITAFSARKISNGSAPNDGIPDGTSLAHIVSDPDVLSAITEIKDDNTPWKMRRQFPTFFSAIKKLTLNCDTMYSVGSQVPVITSLNAMEELDLPYLLYDDCALPDGTSRVERNTITNCSALKVIKADALLYRKNCNMHQMAFVQYCSALTHFYARNFEGFDNCDYRDALISHCDNLEHVYLTAPTFKNDAGNNAGTFGGCPNLIDIEVGCYRPCDKSLNLKFWNPTNVLADADKTATFLQNFREHIALRLTANGSGKTLSLSQAVFDTIWNADGTPKSTDPDSVIYQINKIIKTDKHWSVNRA